MTRLTAERARSLLSYDPLTGDIVRKVTCRNSKAGVPLGSLTTWGYLHFGVDREMVQAHRVAWLLAYGTWPQWQVDHINGNRTDNRLENLRDVPRRVNLENRRAAGSRSLTGFLGVTAASNRGPKRWRARIQVHGKIIHVGVYETPETAHEAYVTAKRKYHEGCTL